MRTSSPKCILALDAGGTSVKLGLVLPHAIREGVLDLLEIPMPSDGPTDQIRAAYSEATRTGMACAARRGLKVAGVGISTPGPFDYKNGVSLMDHKYAAIKGMRVRPFIEKAAGFLPIRFIHDSFAFLLGELALGDWACYHSPCAVIIGTGLGFAAMRNGRLQRNPQGGPGISIYRNPYRDGIAEDFVSRRGIQQRYWCLGGTGDPSVKEIAQAAKNGDALCARVFEETGTALAEILAPIVQEGGFDCILLGGQIAKSGPLLTVPARKRLDSLGTACTVATALHIDEASLVGAARLLPAGEAIS
jgi:glucokinase